MDASILHRKPCLLALLALHLRQPHVTTMLRPNRIKTWHSNYDLRSIKNQKKSNFIAAGKKAQKHVLAHVETLQRQERHINMFQHSKNLFMQLISATLIQKSWCRMRSGKRYNVQKHAPTLNINVLQQCIALCSNIVHNYVEVYR